MTPAASAAPDAGAARRTAEAVWRIESARVIGGLARIVHDIGWAEDLAQDALVAALEQWPQSGIPDNPGAWLMATAKHRAIDQLRTMTGNDVYQRLAGLLLKARDCHVALGTSQDFRRYLVAFRTDQRRKRALMRILAEHGL